MLLKWIPVPAVLLAVLTMGVVLAPAAGASTGSGKCSSFASQKAAQDYFVGHGGSSSKDIAGLDPDGDGLACPDDPGPFAAYVELNFARGFFYGTLVCVDYPAHRSKAELEAEEEAEEEAAAEGAKRFSPRGCGSDVIEVELEKVGSGGGQVVATHKAEAAQNVTLLPLGTSRKDAQGSVLSFEFKLEPKSTAGTFYALSEECFGTPSRRLSP